MKGKLLGKSRIIAILCCFAICLAALLTGAFLLNKKNPVYAVEANIGFYNTDGASLRFDEEKAGLRYQTVVTKEQYDSWTNAFENSSFEFHTKFKSNDEEQQDQDILIEKDIKSFDFSNGNFCFYSALFFDLTDEDLTGEEIYKIFTTEWTAESYAIVKTEGEEDFTIQARTANNSRSLRNVALVNNFNNNIQDENKLDILSYFYSSLNVDKTLIDTNFVNDATEMFYDEHKDETCGLSIPMSSAFSDYNILVGANVLSSEDAQFVGNELKIKNAQKYLSIGENALVFLDDKSSENVYVYSAVTDVTEVFYSADGKQRLKDVFELKANADRFSDSSKHTESYTDNEGVTHSADFYEVNRGYYVLAEDIDFEGEPFLADSELDKAMRHNISGLYYGDVYKYSGLFGFGGTFDGRGHTISNFIQAWNTNDIVAGGLFGAFAYGATVKNVGFNNFLRQENENQRPAQVLATFTGSKATADQEGNKQQIAVYNYLKAKFGTTNCIKIDNVFISLDQSTVSETDETSRIEKEKSFTTTYNGERDIVHYMNASIGMVYEGDSNFIEISNSIMEIPSPGKATRPANGGVGFVSGLITYNNNYFDADGLKNCYLISGKDSKDRFAPVFNKRVVATARDAAASLWYENVDGESVHVNLAKSYEIYAANDFRDLTEGLAVYSGYDTATGKWIIVEANQENGYENNVKVYHFNDVLHYENYTDMSLNNTKAKDGFDNNYWDYDMGAIIWKGISSSRELEVVVTNLTTPGAEVCERNDELSVSVKLGGQKVTDFAVLSTSNEAILTVDNATHTAKCVGSGEAVLTVTVGSKTKDYKIVSSTTDKTEYTLSTDYSAAEGIEGDAYSVLYKQSGNDLVKTSWEEIYKAASGNSNATVSSIQESVSGSYENRQIVTDSATNQQIKVENPSDKVIKSFLIDGSEGYIGLPNVNALTLVIEDAAGFKYINKTATTRSGYYVLANDYNAIPTGLTVNSVNNELNDKDTDEATRPLAYSMGGYDETLGSKVGFLGTFDGLGHEVKNVETRREGLFGNYISVTDTALIKNVKFTNITSCLVTWSGQHSEVDGRSVKKLDYSSFSESILLTQCYAATTGDNGVDDLIRFENCVFSMSENKNEFREHSKYAEMLRGDVNSTDVDGGTRWRFIFVYNDNGNNSYRDIRRQKYEFVNTVLEYQITNSVGNYATNYGGQCIIAMKNNIGCDDGTCNDMRNNMLKGFEGLTTIVKVPASKHAPFAFVAAASASNDAAALIAMPSNYFTASFGADINFTSKPYYMGFDNETDKNWVYSANSADIGVVKKIYGSDKMRFVRIGYNSYESYADAVSANVNRIGNYSVSASGLTWNPLAD